MFASIRRHQKWLLPVIMVIVILSFVVYLGPTSSGRRGGAGGGVDSKTDFGFINGRALSRKELFEAYQDSRLEARMYSGRWPEEDETSRQMFNPDTRIQQKLVLLEKVNETGIRVGDEAVVEWIANVFRDPKTGGFQLEAYQRFLKQVLQPQGITEKDFQGFARRQVAIEHLVKVAGIGGGLVSRGDAESLFRREHEQMNVQVAQFNASNHLASVAVSDAVLAQFYTNNMARYRTPEQVQVSYVKYDATNHLAAVDAIMAGRTNLPVELMAEYQRRGAETFKDADGKVLSQEAALLKIKDELRQALGVIEAQKQAAAFAQQLFDLYEKQPKQTNNLERLAAALGVESRVTEPFSRREGPTGLRVPDSFSQMSFALSDEQPMASEPVTSDEAAYILALKRKWPSEVPALAAIRDQVLADYRKREALEAARRAGEAFHVSVTNGLAQNKTFEVISAESKVKPVLVPAFSLSTQSLPGWQGPLELNALKETAAGLAPGKISDFVPTQDGGFVLQLISKQPVDDAVLSSELPAFITRLRAERKSQALSDWFAKQLESANLTGLPSFSRSKAQGTN